MLYQGDIVSNFAFALSEAHGFEACFKLLKNTVEQLGFDGVLFMSIPVALVHPKEKKPITIFQCSDAYAPTFLEHYAQADFAEHDFTIKEIAMGKRKLIDWWGAARKDVLNEQELNVITVAREDYKMRNGLSIPILCTPYEISGGSVVCYGSDSIYAKLINDHSSTIKVLFKLFYGRVHADIECKKVFISPLLEKLNSKERMLLKFIVRGFPLKVIDKHCELSPGYAKNMLVNVGEKLGVSNAHELRYLLGVYRLIEML